MKVSKKWVELSSGSVDFGIRDQKGRAVGYHWRIFKIIYTPATPDSTDGFYTLPDDTTEFEALEIVTSPTRNGEGYGPSSNSARVASIAEGEALIAKRTANARKRDAKKFGGRA